MMPDKPYRVRAFTIMEVTITMLIAAIVIGITYTSYTIVSKSYLAFKKKNEDMAVLARLDQLLRRDFDQAELISASGNQLLIRKVNLQQVKYEFGTGYVVRNTMVIDTFKAINNNYQVLFEGALKNDNLSTDANPEDGRIDELSFTVAYQNENVPYHYTKKYSSANLFKRNDNAIN